MHESTSFRSKYELLGLLGTGGMGVIYKARQTVLNKIVAIKMLHPHLVSAESLQRFQVEGRAASVLSHPNIVAVYDFGMNDMGQPYMVMEFVEGKTLAGVLAEQGPLNSAQFRSVFVQVCDALTHAHKRSVLHRDVKPSNIMIVRGDNDQEQVRIMDFGIAKLVSESDSQDLTRTGEAIGSPAYMSPEQGRGTAIDQRSDIYSLGCVMYESLTGAPPFTGKTAMDTMLRHLQDKPLPLSQASLGKRFPSGLEHMIMRMLEKDPAARYQSMDEVKNDLLAGGTAAPQSDAADRKRDWRPFGYAAGAVAGVLALWIGT
ncbi:MAG: serine/threonine protein kinase, partial [Terriglobales bacterium]